MSFPIRFFIGAPLAILVLLKCVGDENPYLASADSGVRIVSQSFGDGDTVSIFSTESLTLVLHLKEYIDHIALRSAANRLWSGKDTVITADLFDREPFTLMFSFYDTGWQEISVTAYRSMDDSAEQTLNVYARSPLWQAPISAGVGDTVLLSTPSVNDDARYVWDFRDGTVISSNTNNLPYIVKIPMTTGVGDLYVSDSSHRSPSASFTIAAETTATINDYFTLQVSVSPAGSATVARTVNGAASNGPYQAGTEVDLTAKPAAGYLVGSWSGPVTATADPAVVKVRMDSSASVGVRLTIALPVITRQPRDTTINDGLTASFTIAATGTGLTYHWQKNAAAISGATAARYTTTIVAVADSGAVFRCVIANSAGAVTSSGAVLSVRTVPPSITIQPMSHAVIQGDSAIFSVAAGGTLPLSYQWFRNDSTIEGATANWYTIPDATASVDGARYHCQVSNSAGNDTSTDATLTVKQPAGYPQITSDPQPYRAAAGGTATFTVRAVGSKRITYQWQVVISGKAENIAGATGPTYKISPVLLTQNGQLYQCVVSTSAGSVTSAAALLTVQ